MLCNGSIYGSISGSKSIFTPLQYSYIVVLVGNAEFSSVHSQYSLRGICLSGGNYFQGKFYGEWAIFWGSVFLVDNYPRGQLSWRQSSRGQLSRGQFSPGEIVRTPSATWIFIKKPCKHFLLTILWFNNRYLTTEPKLIFAVIHLKTKTAVHTKSSSGSIDRGAIIQGEIIQGPIIRKTIIQGSIFLEPSKSCFNVILILTLQFKIRWRY